MSDYPGELTARKQIADIATQVAEALDGDWTVELPEFRGAYLKSDGQQSLWMAQGYDTKSKGRLVIHGDYPGKEGYRLDQHEITVAATKTPAQIAKDIERRLLPGYRQTLAERVAKLNRDAEARDKRLALAERLMEAIGPLATLPSNRQEDNHTVVLIPSNSVNKGYGNFNLWYEADKVTIELHSVDAEIAVEIAKALRGRR